MSDHFTVVSYRGEQRYSRVVIAADAADAEAAHREHYPGAVVVSVLKGLR